MKSYTIIFTASGSDGKLLDFKDEFECQATDAWDALDQFIKAQDQDVTETHMRELHIGSILT